MAKSKDTNTSMIGSSIKWKDAMGTNRSGKVLGEHKDKLMVEDSRSGRLSEVDKKDVTR